MSAAVIPVIGNENVSLVRQRADLGSRGYIATVLGAPVTSTGADGSILTTRHPLAELSTNIYMGENGLNEFTAIAVLLDTIAEKHQQMPTPEYASAVKHLESARDMLIRRASKRTRQPKLPPGCVQESLPDEPEAISPHDDSPTRSNP